MPRKVDIIVIGELNVDIILNDIDNFPVVGKEILANSMSVTLGSSSAIFASNLSTLGSNVSFIGKIGKDIFAKVVLDSLKNKNVDIRHILKTGALNTGATIVLNYGQNRANVTYQGAMIDFRLEDIPFESFPRARHMHLSNCFLQPGIRKDIVTIFRHSKELGLTTSFDPQWDPEEKWELPITELLPYVDVFLPNINEFKFITRSKSVEEGIQKINSFSNFIIIKNGSKGAIAWNGKDLIFQKAFKNDHVEDCIGAGDSFNAGFIKEFIEKKPLTECLEKGALIGAVNTTMAGGTGAFESIEKVRRIAQEKFNYNYS